MIHFPTGDQRDDVLHDPARVCDKDLTPAQLQAMMRSLDEALAEAQRLRAAVPPHSMQYADHR